MARSLNRRNPVLYELVNPSDPYTFRADNLAVAAAVVQLLGRGMYMGAPQDEGAVQIPPLKFVPLEDWLRKHAPESVANGMEALVESLNRGELAPAVVAALDSVLLCSVAERADFEKAWADLSPEKRLELHDAKRSSLNDIGRFAWHVADKIRAELAEKKQEPAQ